MKDITVTVPDNEYAFFMKLVKNFDFVKVKEPQQNTATAIVVSTTELPPSPEQLVSPALAGEPMTNEAFQSWVQNAEAMSTTTLEESKTLWESKRSQLQQLIR
jgi:hypothetical protein